MGLEEIRQKIDQTDEQMRALFLQRMELARQVIETKKQTGQPVYIKEREQKVLDFRSNGIQEEYLFECRAFFRHIMEISRTYQYSKLVEETKKLQMIPQEEGKIVIEFFCQADGRQIAVFLNAAMLAGLNVAEITAKEQKEGMRCRICLSGDVSSKMAKAVILQILNENETAEILPEETAK